MIRLVMTPRILLINPWIHDFAAFNLWSRPLGLFAVAEYLSAFDACLLSIDCTDSFEPGGNGTGKYRSSVVPKPAALVRMPRFYKRYGISREEFRSRLEACAPFDIVLVTSIMTYWYPGIQETIGMIREISGSVPVVLGGIYPTLYPEHSIKQSGADRIYTGRISNNLTDLFGQLGIVLKRKADPQPYYSLGLSSPSSAAALLTSTGCPYRCSYCASGLLSPEYSQRSAPDLLKEVEQQRALGVRDFAFYDDALLYQSDTHIKPFLESLVRSRLDVRFHAPNGLHARMMDPELAALMKKAGFMTIRLSLETIDPHRQKKTGGKVTNSDFERAVSHLKRAGFTKEHLGAYLLYGLPGQSLEEVERGVDFLKALDIRIHLAEFSPIKGTSSWTELVKQGTIPDDLDPLLTNNTVFSYLYSGYDRERVERLKISVKEYNRD